MEPLVTLEDVRTRPLPGREDHAPLAHVSLTLAPRQVYALLGPRGAGKSDLLRLLAGRLMPTAGLVRYGLALGASNEARIHNIGYCAQRPELAPGLSVRDHLSLFAAIAKLPETQREGRIEQVAQQLELLDCMESPIEEGPAEMQQRLHVALSMLHTPRLWLLDEPFAGLPGAAQETLWRNLAEHRELGNTAVLVCSELARVRRGADHVLLLRRGTLVGQGTPDELAERHGSLERAFDVLTGNEALN